MSDTTADEQDDADHAARQAPTSVRKPAAGEQDDADHAARQAPTSLRKPAADDNDGAGDAARQAPTASEHDDGAEPTARRAPTNFSEAVGGPLGMAETALPAIAFTVAYTASGSDTNTAAIVAVGLALVLTVARLARRESPQFALSGLIGVGFAAFVATRSGKAENFFLPGLLANAAYASAFLISLAVRRPLVGVIVTMLDGGDASWRQDPPRMRAFATATWLWAGLFVSRLVVMLPLYLAGMVVALGVARTAMGLPIFGLGLWLTWLIVRRVRTPPVPAPT